MKPIQFPPWPVYASDEREAVDRVLRSGNANYWNGDEGKHFEKEFANFCGAKHGLCVCNGTLALELTLRGCSIGNGDEVVVTPRSFLATAAAIVAVGAVPIFAEVDLHSGNITANTIEAVCTDKTRALLVVHLGGWPAEMPAIMALARSKNLKVIEDCAQAHGASIDGTMVGSFGDAATFSFCQDKIMSTAGEGGMVLTSDDSVFELVWSLRDHGRDRTKTISNDHPEGFRWSQIRIGTNARMTEVQAALGRVQLHKLPSWLNQRRETAAALEAIMQQWDGVEILSVPLGYTHAYYRLCVLATNAQHRDTLMRTLNTHGVPASVGVCPEIYREEAFQTLGYTPTKNLPIVKELGDRSLVLPVHPGVESVVEQIATINL